MYRETRKYIKWSSCRTCFFMYSRRNPQTFFVVDGEWFFKLSLFQSENLFFKFIYPHLCSMFFLRHLQQSGFNLPLFPRKSCLWYGRCPCEWCNFTWCFGRINDASCLMIKNNLTCMYNRFMCWFANVFYSDKGKKNVKFRHFSLIFFRTHHLIDNGIFL